MTPRNDKTAWLGNLDMDVVRHIRTLVFAEITRLESENGDGELLDRLHITHAKLSEAIRKGGI